MCFYALTFYRLCRERSHTDPRREVPAQSEPHHGAELGGSGGGAATATAGPSTGNRWHVDDASRRRHEREQLAVPRLQRHQRRHDRFHG